MIIFKTLTLKNFFSIGNVPQTVIFKDQELVHVLGENQDMGGMDSRNGTGKTTLINGLSYALYGKPLVNIKLENLINKVNQKQMIAILEFSINGNEYKIERGRKPNIFKFTTNGKDDETSTDETQGENRHTQERIEKVIGFSFELFKHTIALNTSTDPFLSSKAADQREVIEHLLAITKLSEKAEKLSAEIKITKDSIKEEEYKIKALDESNKLIQSNIRNLEIKSQNWVQEHTTKLDSMTKSLQNLDSLDIESEILAHQLNTELSKKENEISLLSRELRIYNNELASNQRTLTNINASKPDHNVASCPVCNQSINTDLHMKLLDEHSSQVSAAEASISTTKKKVDELTDIISTLRNELWDRKSVFYQNIDDAYNHKSKVNSLIEQIELLSSTENPYADQIDSLKSNGLKNIDYTVLNELVSLKDHQDFLQKLLMNKDSFIRKLIIEQNISFLNSRLTTYLDDIGLPHAVKFKTDLEVEITLFGMDYDFGNLSRGERTRLTLALSWAFRDVYETLYEKINLMFVDELIDQGLDSSGVEASLMILKKMSRESKRDIYLVSHRDELSGRIPNVLKVVKCNGFTTIESVNIGESDNEAPIEGPNS